VIGAVVAGMTLAVAAGLAYRKLVEKGVLRYNRWDRRVRGTLRPGGPAPDVEVLGWDGAPVRLSALWRERAVVLIFGSCT